MKKYVIEREIPNIGKTRYEELQEAAAKSNFVLHQLAPDIQWLESFIAEDKMFCIYLAKNEAIIYQDARGPGWRAPHIHRGSAVRWRLYRWTQCRRGNRS